MNIATRADIVRLFPGADDHVVVALQEASPTVSELEAAAMLLADTDEGLVGLKRLAGERIERLLTILANAQLVPEDDR